MSRFGDDCDEIDYNNAGDLWWANIERALAGKRGQAALAELEEALLELPEKVLIEGHLSDEGRVCAVGALVLKRRMSAGEQRAAVLAQLEGNARCECSHGREHHEDGAGACSAAPPDWKTGVPRPCWCEQWSRETDEEEYGTGHVTANAGVSIGLTYALAWRLAYLNDEDCSGLSPEARYARVLMWVRRAQGKPVEVAA